MHRKRLRLVLAAITATVCVFALKRTHWAIPTQNIGGEAESVILPTSGTIDERPFFSTRRHPAIGYDRETQDIAGQLVRKVNSGELRLRFDKSSGYLLSVLEALKVPVESQSLVFSKTSLQSHFINPTNPRALYFSDEASVGFIRNAPL